MPKGIELTVELNVQKVSCPGVWLCQDGRVSLNVFTLGTSYQTCMLPPTFPLIFKDVFYFRKRFARGGCSLSNISCLLKDETIYCELVQWCNNCSADECTVLAQYLGTLNDVLFPPNMCSTEGVDLLMRRSSEFPGILSPKIEITTKMRVDEIVTSGAPLMSSHKSKPAKPCKCPNTNDSDMARQKTVCHTPLYHRHTHRRPESSSARTRPPMLGVYRSEASSRSLCSVRDPDMESCSACPSVMKSRFNLLGSKSPWQQRRNQYHLFTSPMNPREPGSAVQRYQVYTAQSPPNQETWLKAAGVNLDQTDKEKENQEDNCYYSKSDSDDENKSKYDQTDDETSKRVMLESLYIEQKCNKKVAEKKKKKPLIYKSAPCTCEICLRYHQLFDAKCNLNTTVSGCYY